MSDFFEKLFKLKNNNTDISTELIAGVTTFLTMSYVIIVSPSILSTGGIPFSGALTATILVSAFSSILMGLVANLPFALAPGMGVPWQTALGTVFISGLILLILSIIRVREMIVQAIPDCIRYGVAAGIGLFITLIGLKEACFIVYSPKTLVTFGKFTPNVIIFLTGPLGSSSGTTYIESAEERSKGDSSNALRDCGFCGLSLDLGVII
jgi:AGZA family xanthine/uracil permease-like MFS transporter